VTPDCKLLTGKRKVEMQTPLRLGDNKKFVDVVRQIRLLKGYYADHGSISIPPRQHLHESFCRCRSKSIWVINGVRVRTILTGLSQFLERNFKNTVSLVFVIYTTHLALPSGLSTRIGTIGLSNGASPEQIRSAWGPGDAGSLMDAAITWSHLKNLNPVTQNWIVHLWSPGMPILEVPLIWLARIGIPLFWSLLVITILLWTLVLRQLADFAHTHLGKLVLLGILATWFFGWDFQYIFRDDLFYTEGISYGLLILGLLYCTKSFLNPDQSSAKKWVIGALFIGLSVWVRHVSDSGNFLLVFISASITIIVFFSVIRKYGQDKRFNSKKARKVNKKSRTKNNPFFYGLKNPKVQSWLRLATIGLIAISVTLPWRAFISPVFYGGVPGVMSSASADLFSSAWQPSPSSFWASTGPNWACKTDPAECAILNLNGKHPPSRAKMATAAILSIAKHPIDYIKTRIHYVLKNWIGRGIHLSFQVSNLIGLFYLFLPILILVEFLRIRDRRKYQVSVLWISFWIAQVGQLALIHFEARYFIPLRLLESGYLITLISLRYKKISLEAVPQEI
jgi:hypothetical protein